MARMFEDRVVSQIQSANDIVDLIGEYVNLVKKGSEMVGLCPFHQDHSPSMNVSSAKQIFKCFACGAGGDVFKFVQLYENLTFPQAIERLAERAGIKLEQPAYTERKSQNPVDQVDPNRLAKANIWAVNHFRANLSDEIKGKSARQYLGERQISDESVAKWWIGLALGNSELLAAANSQKASIELLKKAGLVTEQLRDKFVNRLMFPIADASGRVIAFGGRTLDGHPAKYMNSPATALFDKSNSIYGLGNARHAIVKTGTAVIVEGYTDVIMAHQFGCENVVATLGTSFTTGHARILRRYAKKLVLLFDSDTAGIEAANRAIGICLAQKIDITIASVPEGKDPCDFLIAAGREQFQNLVDNAEDVFKFKWRRLAENFSGDETLADNKTVINEFLQAVATAAQTGNLSPVDRGLIVNRLSKIIGLSSNEINAELRKRMAGKSVNGGVHATENRKVQRIELGKDIMTLAQREILEVLLCKPELLETIEQRISVDFFDNPTLKKVAALVLETFENSTDRSLAAILARAESVEAASIITDMAEAGEKKGNYDLRLSGAMSTINLWRKQKKMNENEGNTEFLQNLCDNVGKGNPYNIGMV